MYSRNQINGRGRKNDQRDSSREYSERNEEYRSMSEDEYELYRYNIPPKYDGSRFTRENRRAVSASSESEMPEIGGNAVYDAQDVAPCTYDTDNTEESMPAAVMSGEEEMPCSDGKALSQRSAEREGRKENEEKGELIHSLLKKLRDRFGSEELLITALILIIADGDCGGDILLFLALLLTVR